MKKPLLALIAFSFALSGSATRAQAGTKLPFEESKRQMAPLTIGPLAIDHPQEDGSSLDKYSIALDGIVIRDLRLGVVRDSNGETALDLFVPPADLASNKDVNVDAEQAAAIAVGFYPTLAAGKTSKIYLAEETLTRSIDLNTHTINSLTLAWEVELRWGDKAAAGRLVRLVYLDAKTGALIEDNDGGSDADPSSHITGIGVFNQPVSLKGEFDGDLSPAMTCLRDPTFHEGLLYYGCGSIIPNSEKGVAAYYHDSSISSFIPVRTSFDPPILGTGNAPINGSDDKGYDSLMVDAYFGVDRARDFFRQFFGRIWAGSKRSKLSIIYDDTDPTKVGNAEAFTHDSNIYIYPIADKTCPANVHNTVMAHEYTHLVAQTAQPLLRIGGNNTEARAIDEGVADVFGMLVPTTMSVPQSVITAPADPTTWQLLPDCAPMALKRTFLDPRVDTRSIRFKGEVAPDQTPYMDLDKHYKGGVIRKWFYFLANGADPVPLGGPNTSPYLPNGMHGLGVDAAAKFLYKSLTKGTYVKTPGDSTLSFEAFADGMLKWEAQFGCSQSYRAAKNAWFGVRVLPDKEDLTPPEITGEATEIPGGISRFTVRVADLGEGLDGPLVTGTFGKVNVMVNGALVGQANLAIAPSGDDFKRYSSQLDVPATIVRFLAGPAPYYVTYKTTDWCGNNTTAPGGALVLDFNGPQVTTFDDVTSTFATTFNANSTPRVDPEALVSQTRKIKVAAQDAAKITSVQLASFPQSVTWNVNAATISDVYPIDLSATLGTDLHLSLNDEHFNTTTTSKTGFVDKLGPQTCSLTCRQAQFGKYITCDLNAKDNESGVWGWRVQTTSPVNVMLYSSDEGYKRHFLSGSFENLISQGWHWFWQDRPQIVAGGTVSHGPGQLLQVKNITTVSPADPTQPQRSEFGNGTYVMRAECRDFWGNVTSDVDSENIANPPSSSLTLNNGPTTSGSFTFTLSGTAVTGEIMEEISYTIKTRAPGAASFTTQGTLTTNCREGGAQLQTCSTTATANAPNNYAVRVEGIVTDRHGLSAVPTTLTFTIPNQPQVPTTMSESEDNDIKPGNAVASTIQTITGNFQTNDRGQGCNYPGKTITAAMQACFNAGIAGLYCPMSACGDHFTVDLPAHSQIAYRDDTNTLCTSSYWDIYVPGGVTGSVIPEGNLVYNDPEQTIIDGQAYTVVHNDSNTAKKITIAIVRRVLQNGTGACATDSTNYPYTITLRR